MGGHGGSLPFGRATPYRAAKFGRATEPPPASPPIPVTVVSLIRSRPSSCKRQPQRSVVEGQAAEEWMRNIKMLEYRS
jgi:hypothetical protein